MTRLSAETWTPVTFDNVVTAFLRSEQNRFEQYFDLTPPDRSLILLSIEDTGELGPLAPVVRRSLLGLIKFGLFHHVPPTTRWFRVPLRPAHLPELHIIARCGWDAPGDRNELNSVARRWPRIFLSAPPGDWPALILWGHNEEGPFVILEGNHRLLAYASADEAPDLAVDAYVGLSPELCNWHPLDPRHLGYFRRPLLLRQDTNVYTADHLDHRAHLGF